MAAYGLSERFKVPKKIYRLEDPGAYETRHKYDVKQNKYPFSSNNPRKTTVSGISYTDTIYDCKHEHFIPNVTSLKSTVPRFKYEAFKEEDLDEILCRCGLENLCECPVDEKEEEEVVCQAKIKKRLYKGPPPRSTKTASGISAPSKYDKGFEIMCDGTSRRILERPQTSCPPFYDARVTHFPEWYRGWKWSKWTSKRGAARKSEETPGPAHYSITKEKSQAELCAEAVRFDRRKRSKQLRYIEMVQNRNIREGRPGPSDYHIQSPRGTDLKLLGAKAERFIVSQLDTRPGPAAYCVKRDFDLTQPPDIPCHAQLPPPSCFGVKANRFKNVKFVGPGPTDYDTNVKLCNVLNCSQAPFGNSAIRFKPDKFEDDSDEDTFAQEEYEDEEFNICPNYTWQFKSKTKRFKNKHKLFDPIVPCLDKPITKRSPMLQYLAPFDSSEGRFQPWYNWFPLFSRSETPGPAYYCLNKLTCQPAVKQGPLLRSPRFKSNATNNPAPNEYNVRGMEVETHNARLKKNISLKLQLGRWKVPEQKREYNGVDQEILIINRAINQLNVEDKNMLPDSEKDKENVQEDTLDGKVCVQKVCQESGLCVLTCKNDGTCFERKNKLLRYFLFSHPMQSC